MSAGAGLFITFEGGEGAGKSTAAARLAGYLRNQGKAVLLTREPGGTPGAEAIRTLLLDPATQLTPLADTLLHFAARADHVETKIRPALSRGEIVICDRYYDSTAAYQGHGQGVDPATIAALIRAIDLTPDITFMLEATASTAKQRLEARGQTADRYDLMGSEYMARVAAGFRAIAAAAPTRCVLIDANQDADAVFSDILAALQSRL